MNDADFFIIYDDNGEEWFFVVRYQSMYIARAEVKQLMDAGYRIITLRDIKMMLEIGGRKEIISRLKYSEVREETKRHLERGIERGIRKAYFESEW